MIGKRFGRLTVMRRAEGTKKTSWVCVCDCGTAERPYRQDNLRYGQTRSCGCVQREIVGSIRVSHRMTKTPEYRTWLHINSRCTNPKNPSWRLYGGRGITVCKEWANSFEAFYAFMGKRPSRNHSIDRLDPDGNYEPSNCRWATTKEQGRNKRTCLDLRVEHDGKALSLSEWVDETGLSYNTLYARIITKGWSADRALTQPQRGKTNGAVR